MLNTIAYIAAFFMVLIIQVFSSGIVEEDEENMREDSSMIHIEQPMINMKVKHFLDPPPMNDTTLSRTGCTSRIKYPCR